MTNETGKPVILIATVGGSPEPVASALATLRPSVAWFVVSAASQNAQSSRPQVDSRTIIYEPQSGRTGPGLRFADGCPKDHVQVCEVPADNPDRTFALCQTWLTELSRRYPDHDIIADYTGGTKSMTGGLLMAALSHPGTTVQFMVGHRPDLSTVASGTQEPHRMPTEYVLARREYDRASTLVSNYSYASAFAILSNLKKSIDPLNVIPAPFKKELTQGVDLLRALSEWDAFRHRDAFKRVDKARSNKQGWVKLLGESQLGALLGKLASGETRTPTWERCADLWFNCLRCAHRERYDEAIARLYRLLEAVVQTQLWATHNIPNPPPRDRVPEHLARGKSQISGGEGRDSYPAIGLGLDGSVQFLLHLDPRDPVGMAIDQASPAKRHTPEWTTMRNHSILAHGFRSLSADDWKSACDWMEKNVRKFWKHAEAGQLPNSLKILG